MLAVIVAALLPTSSLVRSGAASLATETFELAIAPPAGAEFPRNKPAPAFTLKQLNGKLLSLSSLNGKVVLLDFWGPS